MVVLTLDEIKTHLRLEVENVSQDEYLESLGDAAKDYAEKYIGQSIPWYDDEGGEVPVPSAVKAAMLLMVSDLYENRETQFVGTIVSQNPAFERLLHFYRVGMGI